MFSKFHVNFCHLGGQVYKKSELKSVPPSGDKVLEVVLRCEGDGRDASNRKIPDFFTLEVWRNVAEAMDREVQVGDSIWVYGPVKHERWLTPEQEKRHTYKFLVHKFQTVAKGEQVEED